MTAVMKYAGAFALDDLETEVRRGFERAGGKARRSAGAVPQDRPKPVSYNAVLRFAVVNVAGFVLLAAAWTRGWIDIVVAADQTGLTFAIFGVFLVGLAICGVKLHRIGREAIAASADRAEGTTWAAQYLDAISGRDSGARSIVVSTLRLRLSDWIAIVRHFANSLVLLGLIGTVVGFIIALSGVDPDAVSDVKSISPMVSQLLAGMAVALYTTLAGATLNLWLMVNHRLLAGATARLVATLVEPGEDDECA
ncbi:MAG: MotA/TolQ/ExbB proton channel family protein [Alphaproteobacteria bacterium]